MTMAKFALGTAILCALLWLGLGLTQQEKEMILANTAEVKKLLELRERRASTEGHENAHAQVRMAALVKTLNVKIVRA